MLKPKPSSLSPRCKAAYSWQAHRPTTYFLRFRSHLTPLPLPLPCTFLSNSIFTFFRAQDTGAWVVAPPYRSKGVVHFLGGAFAGAAPQVVYALLLDSLSAAGYTAIATPYAVTFRHDDCARAMRQQFLASVEELRRRPDRGADVAPTDAPVFGLGHSNGSLLHLLIGSFFPGATESNVVMSFNNKYGWSCGGRGER